MRIPYFNDTKNTLYIGGVMIPPGDTREVEASLHPDYKPAETAQTPAAIHIVDHLMAQPAADILAAIPSLAREDLEKLGEREQEGPARKEILSVLAERLLTLASEAQSLPGSQQQAASAEPTPPQGESQPDSQPQSESLQSIQTLGDAIAAEANGAEQGGLL